MTKAASILAVYERFAAEIAAVPDEQALALYRVSSGARTFVTEVRGRDKRITPSQVAAGLEQGLRETPQLIQRVSPQWRQAVARAFQDALEKEYPAFLVLETEKLRKILTRGKIRSESEYYRVRHEIDIVEINPERQSELTVLYGLVDAFETRA